MSEFEKKPQKNEFVIQSVRSENKKTSGVTMEAYINASLFNDFSVSKASESL